MTMKNSFKEVIKTLEIQELTIIKHRYLLKIILFLCIYFFSITSILYFNKNNSSLEVLLCIPFYLSAGASLRTESVCLHMKVFTLNTEYVISAMDWAFASFLFLIATSVMFIVVLKKKKKKKIKKAMHHFYFFNFLGYFFFIPFKKCFMRL